MKLWALKALNILKKKKIEQGNDLLPTRAVGMVYL